MQLREKELSSERFYKEAKEVKALCEKYRVPFIINDDMEVAVRCQADGVHVGQGDMALSKVRELVGDDKIIGVSARTVEQAVAAFLCYVTPAEHLALPNVNDVKQGIIASKIAAYAADIAKGIPGARDIDDKMADARRRLDWEAQFACALDPETARAVRDSRKPENDNSDTCSMCGKFCAVRSMNKALAGEYIDIL